MNLLVHIGELIFPVSSDLVYLNHDQFVRAHAIFIFLHHSNQLYISLAGQESMNLGSACQIFRFI